MPALVDILVLGVLAAVSVSCVAVGVRSMGGEIRLLRRMDDLGPASAESKLIETAVRLFGGTLIGGEKGRAEIEDDLHVAGYYSPNGPMLFAWIRLGASLGAGLVVAMLVLAAGRWSGWGQYFPLMTMGVVFLAARRTLRWRASRRRRKVGQELPFFLDVLTMMLESGVSLDQAFRTFATTEGKAAPILKEAVQSLVSDIERGMPYEAALDRWGDRLGVSGARELASLFKRNLAQGAELSGALAQFAKEFTDRRVSSAREAVGRKAAQMSLVMMIFFMPALLVILAGPAVVNLVKNLMEIAG